MPISSEFESQTDVRSNLAHVVVCLCDLSAGYSTRESRYARHALMASPQIEFDSDDDVKAFAVAQLAGTGLPPGSIRAAALNLGFDQETIWPSVQPGSLGFMIPKFRWINLSESVSVSG
jgi:hypothetical protein